MYCFCFGGWKVVFKILSFLFFFLGQDITGLKRLKIVKSGKFRCHVLSFVKFVCLFVFA